MTTISAPRFLEVEDEIFCQCIRDLFLFKQLIRKTRSRKTNCSWQLLLKMKRSNSKFLFIILLLLTPSILYSATITSLTTGNWSDGGTWVGGTVPLSTDNGVVATGHTVTITTDITVDNLTVNSGAILTDGGSAFKITCTGNLEVNGTITIDGDFLLSGAGATLDGTGSIASTTQVELLGNKTVLANADITFSGASAFVNNCPTLNNDGKITICCPITGGANWIQGVNSTFTYNNSATMVGSLYASAAGNTVAYDVTGLQNIVDPADNSYCNLLISGNNIITLQNNVEVNGNLTISGAAQLDPNGMSLTLGGNWINISSHANPFLEGIATVTFNGSSSQTLTAAGGETFYNLTINKSANGIILNDPITVNNNLILTAGDLDDNGNQITGNGSGVFSVGANGTLTLGSVTSATLYPVNYTSANTTLNEASLVIYNSNVAQEISSSPTAYGDLTLSATSAVVKSMKGNLLIKGTLTINSNNTLDATGGKNRNLTIAGNWINTGTFLAQKGTVTLDGTSDQTIDNTANETFYRLTVNKPGGQLLLAANSDMNITNTLTLTSGIIKTDNFTNNLVVLTDGAIATPGNANSFIDGKIRKIGNDAFTFPLGNAASNVWARLRISKPSIATTEYTAQYFYAEYSDTTTDATLFNASSHEYWTLDQAVNNDDVQVTLFWEDSAKSRINNCMSSDLVVARYNGTDWTDEGRSSIVCDDPGNVTSNIVANYSPFTFGSKSGTSNPLPIELHSFHAELKGDKVDLNWVTASETNNDHFTVQKSVDGVVFEGVREVPGAGNSNKNVYYSAIDSDPYCGNSYYRLKQTDYDGTYAYSEMIVVHWTFEDPTYDVTVHPNPSSGDFYIDVNGRKDDEVEVVVRDLMGNQHYSKVIVPSDDDYSLAVDLSGKLWPGIYVIIASSRSELYMNTIIIH